MKCVLVLNGEFSNDYVFADNIFVIACDGAYKELKKRQIKADLVLGDFDSLGYIPQGAEVFPAEKDMTDGEIGLYKAAELGFKEVDVICFGGKREDHFLGNLSLLIKALDTTWQSCEVYEIILSCPSGVVTTTSPNPSDK